MTNTDISSPGLLTPRSVTWLGLTVNVALAAGKIGAGVLFGSQAILADGFHSLSDLLTDVAVLAGLRISSQSADGPHPFGHRRISTLVAMFVGAALLVVAGGIVWNAVVSYRKVHGPLTSLVPLTWALATIPLKEALYHLTRRVGRRAGDMSLVANAWHHRSDAFSSIAAAVGLTIVAVGGPRWVHVDHLTAMVLSAFLAVAAWRILRSAAAELVDRAPHADALKAIERAVACVQGVRDFHAMRARQTGGKITMDIHVLVDPELTVREGHDIATAVEQGVLQAAPDVVEVIVHVEPCQTSPAETEAASTAEAQGTQRGNSPNPRPGVFARREDSDG